MGYEDILLGSRANSDHTDSIYGDQYGSLFPDVELPQDKYGEYEFINLEDEDIKRIEEETIKLYMEYRESEPEIPDIDDIVAEVCAAVAMDYEEAIEEMYRDDPMFQRDESYRDDMIEVEISGFYDMVFPEMTTLVSAVLDHFKLCHRATDFITIGGDTMTVYKKYNGSQILLYEDEMSDVIEI